MMPLTYEREGESYKRLAENDSQAADKQLAAQVNSTEWSADFGIS